MIGYKWGKGRPTAPDRFAVRLFGMSWSFLEGPNTWNQDHVGCTGCDYTEQIKTMRPEMYTASGFSKKVQEAQLTLSHRLNKFKNAHLWVWKPFWDSMLSSVAGRLLLRVCLCVDEYRWTGLLMAAVGAATSPSILSVVSGPVPLLQIVSRERAHPEDHPAALYFSPAKDDNKTVECKVWYCLAFMSL